MKKTKNIALHYMPPASNRAGWHGSVFCLPYRAREPDIGLEHIKTISQMKRQKVLQYMASDSSPGEDYDVTCCCPGYRPAGKDIGLLKKYLSNDKRRNIW